jgi:hypothetical protein
MPDLARSVCFKLHQGKRIRPSSRVVDVLRTAAHAPPTIGVSPQIDMKEILLTWSFRSSAMHVALMCLFALACAPAAAQDSGGKVLPPVTVTARANPDPVEKSYRKMVRGMALFDRQHGLSPDATLRFKLLPRRRDTNMNNIELEVLGSNTAFPVRVAPDHTFTLSRERQALDEDAQVTPNRKAQSMTWRTEIRTPGLPPNTRRLGDLRLECQVGMEAGLVSGGRSLFGKIVGAVFETPAYCDRKDPRYLFFADGALFGVALVNGERRMVLPVGKLYAGASSDKRLEDDLSECDCEVLLDRTYELPLGDRSWPDDTLVEFDYMDD